MPDLTPEPPAAPPSDPNGPTMDELASTLQAERIRGMQLEQEAAQLRQQAYTQRAPIMPQGPPQVDPLASFTENVLTGDPAQNRRNLEMGLNQRVSRAVGQAVGQVRQEMGQALAAEREAGEAQRVLDRLMNRNPELSDPKNRSAFAAMMTKAHLDSQEQGLRLSMDQIGERAVREYRAVYGPKSPSNPTPFVEGVSSPGLSGATGGSGEPVQKNALETAYGMTAGEIEPIDQGGMQKITTGYVKDKNAYLRKKNVGQSAIVTLRNELGNLVGG